MAYTVESMCCMETLAISPCVQRPLPPQQIRAKRTRQRAAAAADAAAEQADGTPASAAKSTEHGVLDQQVARGELAFADGRIADSIAEFSAGLAAAAATVGADEKTPPCSADANAADSDAVAREFIMQLLAAVPAVDPAAAAGRNPTVRLQVRCLLGRALAHVQVSELPLPRSGTPAGTGRELRAAAGRRQQTARPGKGAANRRQHSDSVFAPFARGWPAARALRRRRR
eukprot:SAG11_NODE_2732_length_3032_cov_1.784862_2_plen_229_part_00